MASFLKTTRLQRVFSCSHFEIPSIDFWQLKGSRVQYDYQIFGFRRLGMEIDHLAVYNDPTDWPMNDIACERDGQLLLADDSV